MAALLFQLMLETAEQLRNARRPDADDAIVRSAEKQLRLILLAAAQAPDGSV